MELTLFLIFFIFFERWYIYLQGTESSALLNTRELQSIIWKPIKQVDITGELKVANGYDRNVSGLQM